MALAPALLALSARLDTEKWGGDRHTVTSLSLSLSLSFPPCTNILVLDCMALHCFVLFMLFCDFLPSLKHTCSSPGSPGFPKPFPNLQSCILNFPLLFPSLVRIAWVALSLVVVLAGWPSFSCHVTPLFADLITLSLEREGKKLSVCFGDHWPVYPRPSTTLHTNLPLFSDGAFFSRLLPQSDQVSVFTIIIIILTTTTTVLYQNTNLDDTISGYSIWRYILSTSSQWFFLFT